MRVSAAPASLRTSPGRRGGHTVDIELGVQLLDADARAFAVTENSPRRLEFLRAIDYDFPSWAEDYMSAMESALGDAYSEPAADVRGFVASVKSG